MNKKQLSTMPIALSEYGVSEAFYLDDDKNIYYPRTEKAVKLFVTDSQTKKRINFWMPKSLLEIVDGKYTHIKYYGIKRMRENIKLAYLAKKLPDPQLELKV